MRVLKYLLLIVGIFVVLGIILYWFHPYAPFFLVASILIQAPIIYFILKSSYCNSYEERIHKRREKYEEEGEWEEWLEREEREAGSVGFRLLPPRARAESSLTVLRLRREALWPVARSAINCAGRLREE